MIKRTIDTNMRCEGYMTNEQNDLDTYEQLYLLNIESQNKMSIADVENFCSYMKQNVVTSQDLLDIINSLNMYQAYFLSYEPIAKRLDNSGKPQLSKRLGEILCDISETATIFRQLNKNIYDTNNNGKKGVKIL